MEKKYVLNTPFIVGDMGNQRTVTEFHIVARSFNFEKFYTDGGKAIMSIVLADQTGEYKVTFTYQDAQSLAFIRAQDKGNFGVLSLTEQIFNKLQTIPDSEGKVLPPGTIV